MNILVTGAAGFLGSHLYDALCKQGHYVVGVDNFSGGYKDNCPECIYGDILNPTMMASTMASIGTQRSLDAVYHCAALAYEGLSVFSPRIVTENIVVGSVNVMVSAINAGVKRFINCSSMARYGACVLPYKEDGVPSPLDPYGIAKLSAENLLTTLGEAHGVQVVHVVPHNIVGPRQKYDDPYRNVASIMINLMLQGRQPIIYGDGWQRRCFSDIRDVVPLLVEMLTADVLNGEVYNIGPSPDSGGEVIRIRALADRIASLLEFDLDPIFVDPRPSETTNAWCSSDKIVQEFGYETRYTLDDSLKSIIDYIRDRGPKPFSYHLPLEIVNDKTPKTWKDRLF